METYLTQITNYLLTQSWQIAALVVLIAAVNLILKNRSAHVRYLLWLIVLAKCFVPPLVTIPLAVLPQDKMPELTLIPNVEMPAVNVEMTNTITSEPIALPSLPVTSPTIMERLARVTTRQWLCFGWLAGVVVFVLFAVIKALRTEFWLKCKRKLLPAELKCEVEELFSDVGVRTFPKVWLVDGIGQPFVWGLLCGNIYLPNDFIKVNSAEHRRGVLGHELSHVLRFDAAVNFLQIIAQAVFWFHPFVWWANKKIRAEREKCCDEMAIARLGAKARDYSAAIVDTLVTEYESARPVPSLAIAGPVKNIEERIKTMLRPGKKFYKRPSLMAVAFILLLALLAVPTVFVLTARAGTKEVSESNNKVTCTGKVIDTQGQPIAGAKVTAYEMRSDGIAGNILLHQVDEVRTADDGAFIFTSHPKPEKGPFFECKIVALKEGLALGWTEWTMREDTKLNIQLGEPTRLEGVIVDKAGEPVAGAQVRANLLRTLKAREGKEKSEWEWLPGIPPFREMITQTNRQGGFLFSNLPADLDVDLLIKAEGKATIYTYQFKPRKSAFKTGQTDIKVVMPDEARIEGQIVHPDTGRGIAGVKFAVVFTGSGAFFYRFVCTTDDNGHFSIGRLLNSEYLIWGRTGIPLPGTYVNAKSGQTTKVTITANKIYYGRILFEDGGPIVITPEPWPGAKTQIDLEEKGRTGSRSVVGIDKNGLFKVPLSQEQYQKLQSGKAWFEVTVPYPDRRAYLGQKVFAYDLLTTDRAKASVAWIARPNSEPGSVVGRLLFEPKAFNIDLSQTSTQNKIILACFFDMQQRPSRYFLRALTRRVQQLKQKGVTVVAIQASKIDENVLNKWVKNDNIPFAVGMVRGNAEKTRYDWGVESLPWMILADRNRVISAEGFGLSELYEKIEAVALTKRMEGAKMEPTITRVLHFPQDQSVGVVYLQDENLVIPDTVRGYHSGYSYAERENFSCARGDVHIPAGKRVILTIRGVGASPERYRKALESLDPDDLHGLEFLFIQALDDDIMPLVARLTGLRRLSLGGVRVSAQGLTPLAQLPKLEELSTPKGMTDAGMAEIAKIQSLKSLDVFHDRMTNKGLRSLGKLASLEVLCLYGNSRMTDDGLKALTQLRSLRHLRLGKEGRFTDRGMDYLAMMPSLKVLWLDTHNVTDEGLRRLSKSRSLERLCICWLDNITDRGIGYLTAMSQLKGLNATHVNLLTNATMAHLATMPNIDDLRLPYRFTDAGIKHLANLDDLKYLSVNRTDNSPLTDKALATISNLRQLEELSIGGTGFTNNGIELLRNLENLSTLHIAFWSGLDNDSLKQLAMLPKLRELSWGSSDNVTMSGLNALNRLSGLELISVYDVRQDDGGLDLAALKKLRGLRIMMRHKTTRVGNEVVLTWDAYHDSDLMFLSGLTNLEDLSLTGSGIGDDGFKHLASLTNLKYLQIGGSANLTDDGLIHLADMRRLDSIFIGDSRITGQGLTHLYPLKTLHIIRINSAIPIGGQAIARLRTELPHLQSLDISQPKPPARSPRTSKPRVGAQAGSAKPGSTRTRNSTRRRR